MLKIPGYQIETKIHESANSLVYRGIRTLDNLPVIFKVLKKDYPTPEDITRYKVEYEITRSLSMAGVIQAYDLQQVQSNFTIILEDFGGESLAKIMDTRRFTLTEFLKLAIQITASLSEIHGANIIHKDINPSNIVLNLETQELKIIDFGIATALPRETLTIKNPPILEGTLAYISPEQTGRMNRSLDYRTDFYSLGATFYEMLTNRLLYETNDALELIHHHLALEPIPPHILNSEISPILSAIVLKLLAKMAEDRYQSSWGIKQDLEQCLIQLQQTGKIASFVLGQEDISDKFHIPEKLYGREKEVEKLLTAFTRVTGIKTEKPINGVEMVLVGGYSGIGKSALVQEIYKNITHSQGYFIAGKFDQYQRNIPYFAIAQAFKSLIKQLLTESEVQLMQWREKLLIALGANSRVISQIIPSLELILGNQPDVPILPPTEAQNRFNQVFQNFIRVFTQSDHPLVMFLDDLQWADSASLKLLQLLATSTVEQSLLLIGAYRDNEVNASHPLIRMIEEIQQNGGVINQLLLTPLSLFHINQLIANTLRCQPEYSLSLAQLVQEKTQGNPFFMNEFIKSLYTENLLRFDSKIGNWQWSMEEIQNLGITDNVVDLMVRKIKKLPEQTQQILKLSACIGNLFDLETLAYAAELLTQETSKILREAISQGLIIPLSNDYKSIEFGVPLPSNNPPIEYKFVHDRIQQSAYSLISENESQIVHWQIGQRLLNKTPIEQREEKIFDITNQLNQGRDLIKQQSERDHLAQLNLLAGEKAKASSAYSSALGYFEISLELLENQSWQTQYELSLNLYSLAAEAAYLNGRFEQMEQWANIVLENAKTVVDKINVYEVKIQAYAGQMQFLEALQIGLQALQTFGVYLPASPTSEDIENAFAQTALKVVGRSIADLINLPPMTDVVAPLIMRLLISLNAPAYQAAPPLFPLIILQMVNLSIDYGNNDLSAFAYAGYSNILGGIIMDIDSSYEFVKLALNLLDKFPNPLIRCKTTFMANTSIRFRKIHLQETIQPLLDAYELGIDTGDIEFAGYSILHHCDHCFFTSMPLPELERKLITYIQALNQLKESTNANALKVYQQTVLNLITISAEPGILIGEFYNEAQEVPLLQQANHHKGLFYIYFNKLLLCYYFEQFYAAIENVNQAENYLDGGRVNAVFPIFYFYDSLARLAIYLEVTEAEKTVIWERVRINQERMQLWAIHAPMNYQNKWYLVEAEKYRVLGEVIAAMNAYDLSISLAKENAYLQEEALANELAAKFYLQQDKITIAKVYLQEARYGYLRWGAKAKVKDLEKRYPSLLELQSAKAGTSIIDPTQSSSSKLEALDLETVLKASHAIASEIVLDQLLATLMTILIENAGAQTGYLILPTQEQVRIEVIGSINNEKVDILNSILLLDSLPTSLINYVIRTHESVVLSHATQEGNFQSEPWIIQHQSKSLLCVPFLNQGKLAGIVLLENNLTTNAFTQERIEIINLLSTQAAISINNARLLQQQAELNESLRAEIVERKQAEKDRDRMIAILEASTDHIGMADPEGHNLWNNSTLRKLADTFPQNYSTLAIPNYHPQWALNIIQNQGIPAAIEHGTWIGETALLTGEGEEIPVSQMIIAHKAVDGNLEYFSTIMRDISEAKHREADLIRAETTLQSLVTGTAAVTGQDFFPALVRHIAEALHVCYALVTELVNGELKALAFWAHGELQPQISYFPAYTPCEFALTDGLFHCETMVQQMFPEDLDLVSMQADSYLGISLKNANGDPIGNLCILDLEPLIDPQRVKTILDVFAARASAELERKRVLEALRQMNESLEIRVIQRTAQLEAANKSLESFSYSISHDLRAPLRAIDGFSRMMEEDYSEQLDTEGNRYLKVVRDNAKRMGELIDDLLNLSRFDRREISKQPIFLNELIQQVLSDLRSEQSGREIVFAIAQLPICQGDLSLLTQVWINLLSNAIKYTSYQPVAHIQIGYEIMDSEGVYFIRDNGSGFDMQYADNLFGVFQRLHREQEFEGTGIGLAIVQRIIQRHGGRIWAEASVNQGATFYFTLPD
jgi:predicted ATPase/signal transduction histidine kinase/tRNA A-37 threonylcarbamoyl transferase component Bud32/PAS domain-containing protein